MSQLHKRFTSDQVKELLERYSKNQIRRKYILVILGIKGRRFFMLMKQYKENSQYFTVQHQRTTPSRRISPEIEQNLLNELAIEKEIIQNKEVPLRSYNYSYIKYRLGNEYHPIVSLNTIIDRAKKHRFYLRKPKKSVHDREVLTHYAVELIQHDASFHLWAPADREKWYLIISLDDYSRFLLYVIVVQKEIIWAHILALSKP